MAPHKQHYDPHIMPRKKLTRELASLTSTWNDPPDCSPHTLAQPHQPDNSAEVPATRRRGLHDALGEDRTFLHTGAGTEPVESGLDDDQLARNLSADDVEPAVEFPCLHRHNIDSQAGCEATAVLLDLNYEFLTPLTPPPIAPCKAKI